jgi:hypothetical protein
MLEWQRDWAQKDTYDAIKDVVKTHYGAYGTRNNGVCYPERFAQEALDHSSNAVHRAYARKALLRLLSLESFERHAAEGRIIQLPPLSLEHDRVAHLGQTSD